MPTNLKAIKDQLKAADYLYAIASRIETDLLDKTIYPGHVKQLTEALNKYCVNRPHGMAPLPLSKDTGK